MQRVVGPIPGCYVGRLEVEHTPTSSGQRSIQIAAWIANRGVVIGLLDQG